jgi:hypothetical protein
MIYPIARFNFNWQQSEDICQRTSDLERIFKDMFETTTSTDEQKNSEAKSKSLSLIWHTDIIFIIVDFSYHN